MKNLIFIIIVTIITLIASFPLVSCSSGTAPTETTPPATTKQSATTPATSTPPETTTAKPAGALPTATTTAPTQSTTTPTTTPELPDLKPYLVDGKSAITVDISNTDYKKFLIKAGVTNAGQIPANNVTVDLYNSSVKIYTWNIGQLKSSESKILEVTVGDILIQSQIFAGQYFLNINCVLSGGGKEKDSSNNKSDIYKAILALPPVAGRESQSSTEKKIQDSIINATWYTESNRAELITILKEVLKDANISWNTFSLEISPFDKYNDLYANAFGTTDAEKQQIKQYMANSKLPGNSFLYGNIIGGIVCIREGTFIQILPTLMAVLGAMDYAQINYTGYTIGNKNYATKLAGSLMEAYGFRVMREKYGLSGLINMSAILNTVQYPNLTGNTTSSINIRRMWALAADLGYPNGDIPSDKILKELFNLISKVDPSSYVADLDKKADLMDKKAIDNIIRWRLVNKELTMLPVDISEKIGSSGSNISLDLLISYQEFVGFPW